MSATPRFLCRDAAALVFAAADTIRPDDPPLAPSPRFVMLSSAGVSNPDGSERDVRSPGEAAFVKVLAAALPPYKDNIAAIDFLYSQQGGGEGGGGGGGAMEWAAVRPDDFIDTGDGPAAGASIHASDDSLDLRLNKLR